MIFGSKWHTFIRKSDIAKKGTSRERESSKQGGKLGDRQEESFGITTHTHTQIAISK